ncbi:MAG: response regulator transcription factor [Deltaproteobacteria bacterium]|nr:response regulator transcription factor [Deltaproteobacteria bacterium]
MPVILLVEDNRMVSLVEARYIQRSIADTNIVVSSNGTSTLELAKARNPDVTILDTDLTETDPIVLHQALCEIVAPSSIIVTGNRPSQRFEALRDAGQISEFLVRPFSITSLVAQVERVLTGQGIKVVPYRSTMPPAATIEPGFDRHLALNQLSGMLGAIRAFEAEIDAEGNAPPNIKALIDEYIPRIVNLIQDVAGNIKRGRRSEARQ